jgi:hypothetical protein
MPIAQRGKSASGEEQMSYRVMVMCRTKWHGSDQELGDIGESFKTKEEADDAAENTEITQEDYEAAAEAQGLEVWLKVVEDKS